MISKKSRYPLLLIFFFILSCTSTPKNNFDLNEGNASSLSQQETVVIMGTNDIHGAIAPMSLKTREKKGIAPIPYEAGGTAMLASYAQILRNEFGNRFLWLDAGDEFQGSVESNMNLGKPMVQFFNAVQLNAAAIGNHEFDFGQDSLRSRLSEAKYPYLAANIKYKETDSFIRFPNTHKHILLNAGHLKVGIIGLSTIDTPNTTRSENVSDLKFENLKATTLEEAQALREKGAQIILVTAHAGLKCEFNRSTPNYGTLRETDPQGRCGEQDEVVRLLRSLPRGTIDAVISGHTHQIVHHWIEGVPVVQGGAFGRYFNVIYLTYDWKQKKLLNERTRIEGAVPVCPLVFKNQNDCNGDRPAPKKGRGPLVIPRFHNQEVYPDPKIVGLNRPVLAEAQKTKNQVIGQAVRPIEHPHSRESELGNLAADALRLAVHANVGVMNSGGLRSPIEAGPITFGEVFQALPFENRISKIQLTGRELKTFLRIVGSGSRNLPSVSGVRLELIDPDFPASYSDLNGDGKNEAWKVNRLIDVKFDDGQPIYPDQMYSLAVLDFIAAGGDDLAWMMSQIPRERIQLNTGILGRDALIQLIKAKKKINSLDQPLFDPSRPRLKFVRLKLKKRAGHPSKKRRRGRNSKDYDMKKL